MHREPWQSRLTDAVKPLNSFYVVSLNAAMDMKHFDLVILGGGILGTAVAALASAKGMGVVLFRENDDGRPRADTLRNQGWLQSGIMYPIHHFGDEQKYRTFALRTYFAGLDMLEECKLETPDPRATKPSGIIGVKDSFRITDLHQKLNLLQQLPSESFRRLESDEVERFVGAWVEQDVEYYQIPDAPFDEAAVVNHFRKAAKENGAELIDLPSPASLECRGDKVFVRHGDEALEAPLTLIAAGAGSFRLMAQIGMFVDHVLHRTPMLVGSGLCSMPAPVFVDTVNGCSAVQHKCSGTENGAVVVGTRIKDSDAPYVHPDDRRIPLTEISDMGRCLHPALSESLLPGRYTAGYEVIPPACTGRTQYERWTVDGGSVVFCSPGRATVAALAAEELVSDVLVPKVRARTGERATYTHGFRPSWQASINMHFTPYYGFNDAENSDD